MTSLPNELITYVLDFSPRSDVMQAAAISRRWRTVAVDHDYFYFTVYLDARYPEGNDPWSKRPKYHVNQVLASGLPLEIKLTGLDHRQQFIRSNDEITWRAHLNTVASCMPRVKAFSISTEGSSMKDAFARLSTIPAPMLHKLRIDVRNYSSARESVEEQPNILNQALFQCSAPRLSTLYLSGLHLFPVAVAAFAKVQDLEIYAIDSNETIGLPLATCFPSLRILLLYGLVDDYATCEATLPSTLSFLNLKNSETELPAAKVNQLFRSISCSLPNVQRVMIQTDVTTALDLALFTGGLTGDLRLSCQVTEIIDDDPSFHFETAVTSLTTGRERIFDHVYTRPGAIVLSLFAPLLNQITMIDVTHISIARLSEIGREFPAVIHLCIDVTEELSPELWPNVDWDGGRKIFGHRANVFPNLKELAIRKKVYWMDPITPAIQIELVELEELMNDLGLHLAQIKLLLTDATLNAGDPIHAAAVISKFRDVVYN